MDRLLEETFDRSLAEQAKVADVAQMRQYYKRHNRRKVKGQNHSSQNISSHASETTLNDVQSSPVQMFD